MNASTRIQRAPTRPLTTHLSRKWQTCCLALCAPWLLTSCATSTLGASMLGSVMTAATLEARQPERIAQERAQQQAMAERHAVPESAPSVETQATYLSVVRQIQGRSLWHASLAHLDALEKQWGVSEDSQLLRADALRQIGDNAPSRALYQQLMGTSHAAAALHGLGLLDIHAQQLSSAIEHMERARHLDPLRVALLSDLGYAYLQEGQPERARHFMRQAAELGPSQLRVFANLAVLLLTQGEEQQASQLMERMRFGPETRAAVLRQALALRERQPPATQVGAAPSALPATPTMKEVSVVPVAAPAAPAPVPVAAEPPPLPAAPTMPAASPLPPAQEESVQLAGGGTLSLRLSLSSGTANPFREVTSTWVASRP